MPSHALSPWFLALTWPCSSSGALSHAFAAPPGGPARGVRGLDGPGDRSPRAPRAGVSPCPGARDAPCD
jgi:hypothetical protein